MSSNLNIEKRVANINTTNNCSLNLNTIHTNFTEKIDLNKEKILGKYNAIDNLIISTITDYNIDDTMNKCDGYIKVRKQLEDQNDFIDKQIQILNNIVGTTEKDKKGEIEQSKENFDSAKKILLDNITTIKNDCNAILSYIFKNYIDDKNDSSIRSKFEQLNTNINTISSSLETTIDEDKKRLQKKKEDIVTVNNLNDNASPFNDLSSYKNTLTDEDDLMYEKVNNLCLGSNVNDSGACKQSEWGCKLSCQFLKNINGSLECSRLGSTANEINYDVYENIYGETVKIHSHIHTHPGPHPHPMPNDS